MGADHFTIDEIDGEVVIAVAGNQQSYTLMGVKLADLGMDNIRALDASALNKLQTAIATSPSDDAGQGGSGGSDGSDGPDGSGSHGNGGSDDGSDGNTGGDSGGHHPHMRVVIAADSGPPIVQGFMPAMGDVIEIRADVTAENYSLFEESGDALGQTVRIVILNDGVTSQIVFTGVGLADLSLGNSSFGNEGVLNEVSAILGSVSGGGAGDHDNDGEGGAGGGSGETGGETGHGSGGGSGGSSGEGSGQTPGQSAGYSLIRDTDGSNPPQTTGVTVNGGLKYRTDTNADDIVGFRPGVDQLDFVSVSVHGMILNKSQTGELVIASPWSPAAQIVQGVTFEDISLDDLGIVGNERLRQDIGGVMSWEKGVGPREADTVYIRSHEYGRHETISDFDPTYMKLSFLYFGTRERLSVEDTDAGLVISSMPTGQSFTFTGVSKADLVPGLLEFHFDQVIEDNLEVPFGFAQDAVTPVDRTVLLTPTAPDGATTDGFQVCTGDMSGSIYGDLSLLSEPEQSPGISINPPMSADPDSVSTFQPDSPVEATDGGSLDGTTPGIAGGTSPGGETETGSEAAPLAGLDGSEGVSTLVGTEGMDGIEGTGVSPGNGVADVFTIGWSYGEHQTLSFDPDLDVLDFGWMNAESIDLSEQDGSVVISLVSNNQSYTLKDVAAEDLSSANIQANDPTLSLQWAGFTDWA